MNEIKRQIGKNKKGKNSEQIQRLPPLPRDKHKSGVWRPRCDFQMGLPLSSPLC